MNRIIQPNRRSFIAGLGAVFAAPAIVRASSLMPVKVLAPTAPNEYFFHTYAGGFSVGDIINIACQRAGGQFVVTGVCHDGIAVYPSLLREGRRLLSAGGHAARDLG